jgi:hypothetical protein
MDMHGRSNLKGANRPLRAGELARLLLACHGITPDRELILPIICGL